MASVTTGLNEVRALLAKEYGSSPTGTRMIVNTLAWLLLPKLYEHYRPSHFSLKDIQKYLQSYPGFNTTELDLHTNEFHRQLIDKILLDQDEATLDTPDTLSSIYSSLLELLTPQNKITGVFPTPQPIARFMVEILDIQPEEKKIYDPACGTCSLLIEAYKHISQKNGEKLIDNCFTGSDIDANILPLGIMNMALHNIDISEIRLLDALAPPPSSGLFDEYNTFSLYYQPVQDADIILTHPPQARYNSLRPEMGLAYYDSWFLQHCMKTLKKNGRCAIVVSRGTLTSNQLKNNNLRKELFTNFNIQLIVQLPPKTFGEAAKHETYLLFFVHGQATRKTLCYNLPRKKGPIEYQDFQPVLDIWNTWKNSLADTTDTTQSSTLLEGMWIETYDEIHRIEQLRAQDEFIKNPYQLYSQPIAENPPHAEPGVLIHQILQNTREIHEIALELQVQLEQKELR